jgi:APA family basic amino acid/polyamine antiporter
MNKPKANNPKLSRQLGLLSLTATGICSMIGASIYIVPIMIQRNVPGIGAYVLPAFLLAAIPALLAAFAYASLSSAMPRAGGSYIFASRGLNPYLGFVASFSQWFGLSIVIGVICYVLIPFFRDIAIALDWKTTAIYLETGWVRLSLALMLLWLFVGINMKGLQFYERTLIPLMVLMFVLGGIVIVAGFSYDHADFQAALLAKEGREILNTSNSVFNWSTFLSAAAVLFSSFIGFDSIAQAGGEAKNPERLLPRAIALAVIVVGCFYFIFTAAVYHAIPWQYIAAEGLKKDISAPGLFSVLLSPSWGIAILIGATIALINDLPAMLLSVSRLLFAWAEDGIFPKSIAKVNPNTTTPINALFISGIMASIER